ARTGDREELAPGRVHDRGRLARERAGWPADGVVVELEAAEQLIVVEPVRVAAGVQRDGDHADVRGRQLGDDRRGGDVRGEPGEPGANRVVARRVPEPDHDA